METAPYNLLKETLQALKALESGNSKYTVTPPPWVKPFRASFVSPGRWRACFRLTACQSFDPTGLSEYLSLLVSQCGLQATLFFPSTVTGALTGGNFLM